MTAPGRTDDDRIPTATEMNANAKTSTRVLDQPGPGSADAPSQVNR